MPSSPEPDRTAATPVGAEVHLTVAAVARRIGVAPATMRTWDRRYGVGPSAHASGSHRRYAPGDVARLERMQQALVAGATPAEAARVALRTATVPSGDDPEDATPQPEPWTGADAARGDDVADGAGGAGSSLRMPGAGRRARGLGRAALALDAEAATRVLQDGLDELGVVRTWDEVARPVLRAVADRWSRTGQGIEVEHLLSEVLISVTGRVAMDAPAPVSARPVLLGSMPGDRHALPLRVLAAILAERGVAASLLGADLPADALGAAIVRTAPAAVFLWAQLTESADTTLLERLPRTRPRTRCFVGGPGWDPALLPASAVALGSLEQACEELAAAAGR